MEQKITLVKDGPLIVNNIDLFDSSNNKIKTASNFALCRCGKSSRKPFCDATHTKIHWKSINTNP